MGYIWRYIQNSVERGAKDEWRPFEPNLTPLNLKGEIQICYLVLFYNVTINLLGSVGY